MKKAIEKVMKFKGYRDEIKNIEFMPYTIYIFFKNFEEKIDIQVFSSMAKRYIISRGYKIIIEIDDEEVIVKAIKNNKIIFEIKEKEEYMAVFELLKEIVKKEEYEKIN